MKFTVCDITFMFYVSVLYQLNIYVYIKLKEGEKMYIWCFLYTLPNIHLIREVWMWKDFYQLFYSIALDKTGLLSLLDMH